MWLQLEARGHAQVGDLIGDGSRGVGECVCVWLIWECLGAKKCVCVLSGKCDCCNLHLMDDFVALGVWFMSSGWGGVHAPSRTPLYMRTRNFFSSNCQQSWVEGGGRMGCTVASHMKCMPADNCNDELWICRVCVRLSVSAHLHIFGAQALWGDGVIPPMHPPTHTPLTRRHPHTHAHTSPRHRHTPLPPQRPN